MISEIKQKIQSILPDFPAIQIVYLFGSQVSGNVGPMSDIDLAILYEPDDEKFALETRFQYAVSCAFGKESVDIVSLLRAPIELAYHIISQGVRLYERDIATRVEFEAKVLGLYYDFLPVLRDYRQQILAGDDYAKRIQRYREAFRRTERTLGEIRANQDEKTF